MILLATTALAHKPSYGGDWSSADTAFQVDDPAISIVVYREITCDSPHLWMTFDAVAGEEVWVQLGTPVIDRLADYRPSMAVLAPGLPAVDDLPFDVPEGLGAVVIDAADEPADFYEPFTQTASWIHAEEWVTTPESGTGYVVAFDPTETTGKVWLAMGIIEDFSDVDFAADAADWGLNVNNFHETGRFETPPAVEEEVCEDEITRSGRSPELTRAQQDVDGSGSGGCSTVPAPFGLWFLPLLQIVRRRRSTTSA